mmetsp:Transcript_14408/g.10398  ORF Transcript_14408/g.10398 Transcript_14408/m.10398 type:complete len:148 (+) Transcript_14408:358-801(+)
MSRVRNHYLGQEVIPELKVLEDFLQPKPSSGVNARKDSVMEEVREEVKREEEFKMIEVEEPMRESHVPKCIDELTDEQKRIMEENRMRALERKRKRMEMEKAAAEEKEMEFVMNDVDESKVKMLRGEEREEGDDEIIDLNDLEDEIN